MSVQYDWPTFREGWAASVVQHLFPGLQHAHPKQYAADVQFVFDWESSVKGGTRLDPLNMNKHGDYKSFSASRDAAIHYLHEKPSAAILAALQKGDYDAAKHALSVRHVSVGGKGKLPSKIDTKTGGYGQNDVPSLWDELLGTVKGMPGQAGKDASGIGSGIGGFLTGHMVLIVLVVVAIVVLKKK